MKKGLLIAEKPSLKRTIEAVYQKYRSEIPYQITFLEQRGHLLTLKTPDEIDEELKSWSWDTLPFHPEDYGGWKYKIIPDKKVGSFLTAKERYMNIKDELENGDYDFVINAGDPDQEGELLVRIVLSALKNKLPVKRYWSTSTTEDKVLYALKNLLDDDNDTMLKNLLSAAYGRQHSDYRFGMNLSRAATLKMGTRVACGRVKTPIMGIICKRENEIKNFKPSTSYGIKALYTDSFDGQMFDLNEVEESGTESDQNAGLVWYENKKDAEDLIAELGRQARVTSFESKRVETYAPKLFELSTAQIAAGKMGFSASRTLEIIQSLYEKGFLSYPRTDCEYMSSGENFHALLKSASSVPQLAPFIQSIDSSVIPKVKATKKWVNDKELAKAGHSAISPTTAAPNFANLSEDEQKIYTMVCKRFVAIFLPPLVQDKTLLITDVSGHTFRSTGKTLVDAGFEKIFDTKFNDIMIPEYQKGDIIDISDFVLAERTTTCPKRFTDPSLIAACVSPHKYLNDPKLKALGKRLKIGTPATRANIIEELINRDKYLMRVKEKSTEYIVPTQSGMIIYENLKDCDICKVDLTGEWEEQLEMVRQGEISLRELEDEMRGHVERLVKDIKNQDMIPLSSNSRKTIAKCPSCGGDIISGPKGFYCSNYKTPDIQCKTGSFKTICESVVKDEEFLEMLKGNTIKKTLKKGTSKWDQMLKYNPELNKIEFVQNEIKSSEYTCPNCRSGLLDDSRVLKCSSDCGFKLYKVTCGKTLTDEQLNKFFTDGSTGLIKGMKGKSGKSFNASIVLDTDCISTKFEFEERKK